MKMHHVGYVHSSLSISMHFGSIIATPILKSEKIIDEKIKRNKEKG